MRRCPQLPVFAFVVLVGLSPLRAQLIEARLPAGGRYHGSAAPGTGDAVVIEGVPGEISVIRLKGHGAKLPQLGKLVDGWSLTLLQANQPTRTWTGGPNAVLATDPVQFGLDGAVAVIVRAFEAPEVMASYELTASSQLPKGFTHPPIVENVIPPPPLGVSTHTLDIATWLRPGLELRVKLHFGPPSYGGTGQFLEFSPEVVATPPANAGVPWTASFSGLHSPFHGTWLNAFEPATFAHATYSVEKVYFHKLTARVQRQHVVLPAPGDEPPPIDVWNQHADAVEVPVGGHVDYSALIAPWKCAGQPATKTTRVWLASPHAIGSMAQAGTDLTGPIALTLGPGFTNFSTSFDLPPEIGPGLYELQLLVGTPGVFGPCSDSLFAAPAALPLRVLEPSP